MGFFVVCFFVQLVGFNSIPIIVASSGLCPFNSTRQRSACRGPLVTRAERKEVTCWRGVSEGKRRAVVHRLAARRGQGAVPATERKYAHLSARNGRGGGGRERLGGGGGNGGLD